MGAKEKVILNDIQLYASKNDARLFRTNTGMAWVGKNTGPVHQRCTTTLNRGDIVIRNARPFHSGWPKGTSDLIGLTRVYITTEMLGRTFAVFTAVEVKTEKLKATKEQKLFINAIETLGGISTVAKESKHYVLAINNFKGGYLDRSK